MSSGFVRSCVHAVVENSPSGFERSVKLKEMAENILTNSIEKEDSFDRFCSDIVCNIEERNHHCLQEAKSNKFNAIKTLE